MLIACTSDLHGHMPDVPDCDLLLIAGDICPDGPQYFQRSWLETNFRAWLDRLAGRGIDVIGIAGNHDFAMESQPWFPHRLPWRYVQDSGVASRGLLVWGSPFSNRFGNWAFMKPEAELAEWWDSMLPLYTDILVVHGPPHGHGDFVPYGPNFPPDVGDHVGSPSLLARIEAIRPKLVVCGHIHAGHGRYWIGETLVVNAAHVDEQYRPHYPIEVVEL